MEESKKIHGIIYKLEDQIHKFYYIGSTTKSLKERYRNHKADSKRQPNRKLYVYINKAGWDNIAILPLKEVLVESIKDIWKEEKDYVKACIHDNKCLNVNLPFLDEEEKKMYFKDYKHRDREHYQQNKEKILQRQREHYQQNKEKILQRQREHYQQNKEMILQQRKEHYQQNKENIVQQGKEKH